MFQTVFAANALRMLHYLRCLAQIHLYSRVCIDLVCHLLVRIIQFAFGVTAPTDLHFMNYQGTWIHMNTFVCFIG